jgi:hypothetical protein
MQERRRAFRMRTQLQGNEAVLRIKDQDLQAEVQDESARGLAVVCGTEVPIELGQKLHACTPGGWFEAKVVRLESAGKQLLVGLERGREVLEPGRRTGSGAMTWAVVAAAFVGLLAVPAAGLLWNAGKEARPAAAKGAPSATLQTRPGSVPAQAPEVAGRHGVPILAGMPRMPILSTFAVVPPMS